MSRSLEQAAGQAIQEILFTHHLIGHFEGVTDTPWFTKRPLFYIIN
ncbi:MAG: hypothetical protein RDV48_28825 [Candidatus Eremiobacteraeota bacterium]|nr:hypothetical protein [Candidatus Eremiobacteraeota bacterium]